MMKRRNPHTYSTSSTIPTTTATTTIDTSMSSAQHDATMPSSSSTTTIPTHANTKISRFVSRARERVSRYSSPPTTIQKVRVAIPSPSSAAADGSSTLSFDESTPSKEGAGAPNDTLNYALLIVLYTLQGIPMGLSASIPFLLQDKIQKMTAAAAAAAASAIPLAATAAVVAVVAEVGDNCNPNCRSTKLAPKIIIKPANA